MAANKVNDLNSRGKKKKKNVMKFKNILAQPIPQYWPEITETDAEILKQILSDIKPSNNDKINLSEIGVTLGMNACLRKLKSGQISCCLISTEIKPKFIVNQIVYMTISNCPETKLLCVPNLKTITEQVFGIQSLLMAIHKQKVPVVENWILKKSENYPIPEEIIQYYSKKGGDPEESKTAEEKKSTAIEKETEKSVDFNQLYLPKPCGASKRAFVPENAKNLKPLNFEIQNKPSTSSSWGDYISFSGETLKITEEEGDLDSDEECEKDKKRLLDVLEKMSSNAIKSNNKNSENDIEMREIDEGSKVAGNTQELNRTHVIEPIESVLIKKKKRKRKRNSIPAPDSHEKQLHQSEPVFKYISLKVHKIQGNPNRKGKKKKNKK